MDERNFTYMFYGFAAVWAILAGYALTLAGRDRKIRREIENLKRLLEERERK